MTDHDELGWLRAALGRLYRLDQALPAPLPDTVRALGRELALDRPVELIALRRGATTRERTETFLAWAGLLARVNHQNVVGVHTAGVERGVAYFAVEHLGGEPLAASIARGPLTPGDAARLGIDLLQGLEASHAAGLVHPSLSADTVICVPGRSVLSDLSRPMDERATAAADLAAVGAVLYHAVTGRPWIGDDPGDPERWDSVPRPLRPALRRALIGGPQGHWPDTRTFRRALESQAGGRRRPSVAVRLGVAGVLGLAGAAWMFQPAMSQWLCLAPPGAVPRQLALLPLEGAGDAGADTLGFAIANILQYTLDDLPGLSRTPWREIVQYWEARDHVVDGADAARDLKANWAVHGLVTRRGDSLRVRITVFDAQGRPRALEDVPGSVHAVANLADTVGVRLLRELKHNLEPRYAPLSALSTVPLAALKAFFRGEAAFARDAWALADSDYSVALREDSTFALARWRRANVRRWQRLPWAFDLRAFYESDSMRLPETDRALVAALLETDVEARLAGLEAVVQRAPRDAYAQFVYAEELFHRGPLVGRDLEEAGHAMSHVIELDSSFAEAYNHLFGIHLRAGRKDNADSILALRRCVARQTSPGDLDKVRLLQLAYDERFARWRAAIKRRYLVWFADSATLHDIARVARLGVPWFNLATTQIDLSRIVLDRHAQSDSARASARTGIALGLLALGRIDAGLLQLDSAVALAPTPEALLQQAEWRSIPQAVGLPPASTAADPRWEAQLTQLALSPASRTRALWALALRRLASGDTVGFEQARARLDSVDAGSPLAALLRAVAEGARGRGLAALAITDSIRPLLAVDHPPDPFAGVVFHLQRGEWLALAGERRRADREWAWYEGSDFEGWPAGVPQAGEIEATFGAYARWRRGSVALAGGTPADTSAGCALLARSVGLWRDVDPPMRPLRDAAVRRVRECSS